MAPVELFDIDLYHMADKHEALGLGLSYSCHGALCTENEVYHFDNVFFKIGEDEAILVSPSQRVLTGYEALQRSGLIRASVGIAFQAGRSRTPLCSTTTPSGASERRHCQCLCSPLRHGVEQACSAAAKVPPRSPSLGAPLLRVLVLSLRYEASSLPEGCRRRIRLRSVLPSSSSTCSSLCSPTRGEDVNRGDRTCLPGRDCVPPCALVSQSQQ